MEINILIADDMEAHRRRLTRIIDAKKGFNLIGAAKSGEEAIELVRDNTPDIILMDIEMETSDAGLISALKIIEMNPRIKVIMFTIHQEESFISSAFQSGVIDYLDKTVSEKEIIEAIYLAKSDISPIRPKVAAVIRREFTRIRQEEDERLKALKIISSLSPAEIEVLWWLSKGKNRKQIAEIRSVEFDTVKKQIGSILMKFQENRSKSVVGLLNKLNLNQVLEDMVE